MGLLELRERFGFEVVEMPHTLADAQWLWRNPQARADDINAAFADTSIDGIIATIGGNDSVRILPYLDSSVITNNPKVFMGYSDSTTLHIYALLHGLQTFYGPSVMAGIAENGGTFTYAESWIRRTLMSSAPAGELTPTSEWTDQFVPWEDANRVVRRRSMVPNQGWQWLQGTKQAEGHLLGGCLDVLEFLKGTTWWPPQQIWEGAAFYWETSEDAPDPRLVGYWLRNYGMLGILDNISAMLVGRPAGYSDELHAQLRLVIQRIVADEFGRPDLPIVINLDFGHTDPQMVLPNGGKVVVDPVSRTIALPEAATVARP
jgi:muramoyltetrapeptide carboxypeptidase LdcA involved in peptidoglycan recycling